MWDRMRAGDPCDPGEPGLAAPRAGADARL